MNVQGVSGVETENQDFSTFKSTLLTVCLLALFFVAFPLFNGPAEFIGDDYYFIVENSRVTDFTLSSLKEIWFSPMKVEYFPVTVTSYFLEHAAWGSTVKLYRFVNFLIFVALGFASYRLQRTLIPSPHGHRRAIITSFAVITVMLLHPANVESVAAISHRKELLYVLFGMLSFIYYMSDDNQFKTRALALFFAVLSQLSKGTAVMLPVIFIFYELYRNDDRKKLPARLLRVLPFIIIVGTGFLVQFNVALKAGVVAQTENLTLAARAGGIIRTVNTMLGTLLFPHGLSYDYDIPWPSGLPPLTECILPLLAVICFAYILLLRRYRLFLLSMVVFLPLVPYLNIIPLGHTVKGQMVYYDHYLLFTLLLMPLLLSALLNRVSNGTWRVLCAGLAMVAMIYAGYSYYLYGFWQTRETLYRRLVDISPGLSKGYFFLGRTYLEQERYPQAIKALNGVFKTRNWQPEFVDTFQMLGDAYAFSGDYRKGIDNYRRHLQNKPSDLKSLQNLSTALIMAAEYGEAAMAVNDLLTRYPGDAIGLRNLELINSKK